MTEAPSMKRLLSRLCLICLCGLLPLAASAAAAPEKLTPKNFHSPKLRGWINGEPDTGQFLPDSVVVLRVADRVTTVKDFIREWFGSYPEFRPMPDSAGRHAFLLSLRNRDILGMTALAQNRPLGFEDRIALREERSRSLTTAVYQRLVADSVVVTEDEVRDMYANWRYRHHLRHILVADRNAAELVRRELLSGRITWAAAVAKYSLAKNTAGPNGDLGWTTADKLAPEIVYHTYTLKPGGISVPFQTTDGWHIAQSIEREPYMLPGPEMMNRPIRDMFRNVRQAERSARLMATLRLQHGVVYDTAAAELAARQFVDTRNMVKEGTQATININGAVPEFTPADTARLLARWDNGGRFSIGDLVHAYSDIPPVMRPTLNRMDLLLTFTESVALEPFIASYGAQVGLEKDPLVTKPMQRKLEQLMVEHMYADSIGSRTFAPKEERQAYYKKNMPQFFTYPSVDFAAIYRPSKAGADSVERMLRSGIKATAIIEADSLKGLKSGSLQHRRQDEQGAYQKVLFEEMRPGDIQVRGPDRQGDYIVLQLLAFDPGRQLSFEESDAMIAESLQNQKEEAALNAMIERLSKRYKITMYPERLPLIRLVDPAAD